MAPARPHDPRGLLDPEHLLDPGDVRPAGGAVLDLHAHSSDRSRDSGVRVDRIAAQAARRGLDGVVLTEHNATWSPAELREFCERHEVHVLPGMEVGTDVGHVLVYGLERFTPELLAVDSLRRIVESEGAVMAVAHPMRPFHGGRHAAHDEFPEWFDGLEAINGDHADTEGGPFDLLADRLGIAAIGGSDVHSEQAVGRVVTAFESPVEDVESLAGCLRAGLTRPRDLRPRRSAGGTRA
jgi:predicted metal-dependent phosphoesterase TrpH